MADGRTGANFIISRAYQPLPAFKEILLGRKALGSKTDPQEVCLLWAGNALHNAPPLPHPGVCKMISG